LPSGFKSILDRGEMPEGPEIKRAADRISAVLQGEVALLVEFRFAHLIAAAARLTGQRISSVTPRGKAMLTHFENGETLYSHNQLYGEWDVLKHGQAPHATRDLRVALHTARGVAVLYSASDICVLPTADVGRHPYIAKLGVELLAPCTSIADVERAISAPAFRRKALAPLLLDQGFLAGIGNYLRSEILFVARISPLARVADLSVEQRHSLARAALSITRQSYRTAGITNDLTRAREMKKRGFRFGAYRHWVFDRDGAPCHVCGTRVERQDLSGRGLYWCPACQAG
jgi:endonuclease-8